MTHDKFLANINNLPEVIGLAEFKVRHDALLAVLEVHKPDNKGQCERCREMMVVMAGYNHYGPSWPCVAIVPIIRSFEKELA